MYKKTLLTLIIIFGIFCSGPALAGTKFINKDTAKERNDNTFGTRSNKSEISIKSDKKSNSMSVTPSKDEDKENQSTGPIFVTPEIKTYKE